MLYNKDNWDIEYKDNDKTKVIVLNPKPINIKYVVKCRYEKDNIHKQKWFRLENKSRQKFTDNDFIKSFNEQVLPLVLE